MDGGSSFGKELRRLREQRGLSLRRFAEIANYTHGYIGKVEKGDKPPTTELARRCDEVLEAGGQLIALAAVNAPRLAQLPAAVATFVGREQQLRHLETVLMDDGIPGAPAMAAIDGPPGVGKTALALRLAHEVKARFPDGQLYADLHGHSADEQPERPAVVLEEFLAALGVQTPTMPTRVEQRAALYRSLLDGRRVLLVLDNALDSHQVAPLLPGSSGCGVVVTSRKRLTGLGLGRDQRLMLGPMTGQESVSLLSTVIGAAREQDDPQAVADLAQHCGHLPLALRIAAERVATHPHHSMRELIGELDDEHARLDALTSDDSVAVRTVFSLSYRDLRSDDARMFRLLGLHRGAHLGVVAASALAGVPVRQARETLDRLVGVHLLEGMAGDRYRVHDLLRLYAAERAAAEEPEQARAEAIRRLLDWYLHTTYAANHMLAPQRYDPQLDPPRYAVPTLEFATYDEALAWSEEEMSNLVATTRLAVDAGQFDVAWRIPVVCWNYLHLRKRWSSWISAHEAGLVGARRGGDRFGEAWVLNNLANAHRELRRFGEARACLRQALDLRRGIGDQLGEAWSLAAIGLIEFDVGDVGEAARQFTAALAVRHAIAARYHDDKAVMTANRHGEGITLANLGLTYQRQRRYDEALECLNQALDIFREIDDRHGEGYTLVKLGDTLAMMRQTEEALASFQQALVTRREIGDRWGEAETLDHQGQVLVDSGRRDEAHRSWRSALAIFAELGDPRADDLRVLLEQVGDPRSGRDDPNGATR